MKYVRIEEYGICKITNEDKYTLSYENPYIKGCLWKDDYKGKMQTADTIEELCDFALSEWSDGWWETYDLKSGEPVRKDLFIRDIRRGDCLSLKYGIKNDKGLFYVAKMNDKGELELV